MPESPSVDQSYSLKDGHTINFVPGYYQFHADSYGHRKSVVRVAETSINAAGGHKKIDYEDISKKFSREKTSIKLWGYVAKTVPTYQLVESFRDTRFNIPYGKTLDIGCGLGIHLRLLKAWGLIAEAVGIDIYDICSGFDESKFRKLQRKFRLLKYAERLQDRLARSGKKLTPIQEAIMWKVPTVRRFALDYGHRPAETIYSMKFKSKPKIDDLIIGDIFDHHGKYNLVTSFASLDWFTAPEIFPKVYDLLEEGGFFYVWVTNWWQSVNTSNLFGHFPFAPQRMTRDEFFAYAKKTMPDHADDIIKAYGYFDPTQPTLSNYMEVAHEAGFIPVNWKENVHPEIIRSAGALTTLGLGELDPAELDRALADIQRHRPDVRLQDLFAFSHSMLFYKPPKSNGINRQVLDAQAAGAEFHYRPTSAFGRTLKAVAEKIFMP